MDPVVPEDKVAPRRFSVGGVIIAGLLFLNVVIDFVIMVTGSMPFSFTFLWVTSFPAIALLIRSFWPPLSFWRGLAVVFGGVCLGFATRTVEFAISGIRGYDVWTDVLFAIVGIVALGVGFRSGKKAQPTDVIEPVVGEEPVVVEEPLSFKKQVLLVFTDPGRALAGLVAHPRWLGAFAVVLLFSVASVQATYPLIMEARRDAFLQGQPVGREQADIHLERLSRPPTLGIRAVMVFFQVIGQAIGLVVIAGALMFGGNILLGGESNFVTLLAITAHSWLVLIPKTILTVPLMLAKDSAAVSTSLQVLLPSDQWTTPLGLALGAVDVFSIWMIVLIIIGISAAYRFSRAKSAALVVSLYVIMILISTGSSALISGLMLG